MFGEVHRYHFSEHDSSAPISTKQSVQVRARGSCSLCAIHASINYTWPTLFNLHFRFASCTARFSILQDLGGGFVAVENTPQAIAACQSEFNGAPGKGGQYETVMFSCHDSGW